MASKRIPYEKLKQESSYLDDEDIDLIHLREKVIGKIRKKPSSFWNIKFRKVHLRKRLRIKVPSLKKFLRRKARFIVAALAKTLKRLKESQSHFGDLFAGNYMFMQVNPTPLKIYAQNHKSPSLKTISGAGADHLSSLGCARSKRCDRYLVKFLISRVNIRQFPQKKPVADEAGKIKPKLSKDDLAGAFGVSESCAYCSNSRCLLRSCVEYFSNCGACSFQRPT